MYLNYLKVQQVLQGHLFLLFQPHHAPLEVQKVLKFLVNLLGQMVLSHHEDLMVLMVLWDQMNLKSQGRLFLQ